MRQNGKSDMNLLIVMFPHVNLLLAHASALALAAVACIFSGVVRATPDLLLGRSLLPVLELVDKVLVLPSERALKCRSADLKVDGQARLSHVHALVGSSANKLFPGHSLRGVQACLVSLVDKATERELLVASRADVVSRKCFFVQCLQVTALLIVRVVLHAVLNVVRHERLVRRAISRNLLLVLVRPTGETINGEDDALERVFGHADVGGGRLLGLHLFAGLYLLLVFLALLACLLFLLFLVVLVVVLLLARFGSASFLISASKDAALFLSRFKPWAEKRTFGRVSTPR